MRNQSIVISILVYALAVLGLQTSVAQTCQQCTVQPFTPSGSILNPTSPFQNDTIFVTKGQSSQEVLQMILPQSTFQQGLQIDIDSVEILTISGLPFGLSWGCNEPNCKYYPPPPTQSAYYGCLSICGNTSAVAGDYVAQVSIRGWALGISQTISAPFTVIVQENPCYNSYLNAPIDYGGSVFAPDTSYFSLNEQGEQDVYWNWYNSLPNVPIGATNAWLTILGLTGLPSGLDWYPDQPDSTYQLNSNGEQLSIRLCGVPDTAGVFPVNMAVDVDVTVPFIGTIQVLNSILPSVFTVIVDSTGAYISNAGFLMTPAAACGPTTVSFTPLIPFDNSNNDLFFEWDFGNGNTANGQQAQQTSYPGLGTYPISYSIYKEMVTTIDSIAYQVSGNWYAGDTEEPDTSFNPDPIIIIISDAGDTIIETPPVLTGKQVVFDLPPFPLNISPGVPFEIEFWDDDNGSPFGTADDFDGTTGLFTPDTAGVYNFTLPQGSTVQVYVSSDTVLQHSYVDEYVINYCHPIWNGGGFWSTDSLNWNNGFPPLVGDSVTIESGIVALGVPVQIGHLVLKNGTTLVINGGGSGPNGDLVIDGNIYDEGGQITFGPNARVTIGGSIINNGDTVLTVAGDYIELTAPLDY